MNRTDKPIIGGRQIRAARVLLGLSQEQTAKRTGISRRTIVAMESDAEAVQEQTMAAVHAFLRDEGARFINTGDEIGVSVRIFRKE